MAGDVPLFTKPVFSVPVANREQRAFDMFQKKVAFQLSGPFDSWFWNDTLLHASYPEPAIKHALLAISGLVECLEFEYSDLPWPCGREDQDAFALEHYNKAIHILLSSSRKQQLRVDVCLIACILFAFFEVSILPLSCQSHQVVS